VPGASNATLKIDRSTSDPLEKIILHLVSLLFLNLLAMESNGFFLGEITPRKWYFFAIDHEKPFMSRPAITYIINEKQGT
jgi:hypothetical protein